MKKHRFYSELAYAAGLLLLALGTAMTERGGFGISMVVAPAYILHLKVSEFLPWFSFGMAEYSLQAVVLAAMMLLLKRAKLSYFLSFVTAVLYGFALDGAIAVVSLIPLPSVWHEAAMYLLGVPVCCAGIALLFQTYLPPEAYELFVKELSRKHQIQLHKFKTIYDCCSCVVAIMLSLIFFGSFQGIGIGSVVCAFLNGWLISLFSKLFNKIWNFTDRFPLRQYFEE